MWNVIKKKNPIWYIDATGSVHRKVNSQKAVFLYSTVCHDKQRKQIIPVFEFITTVHTAESLSKFITFAVSRIDQNNLLNKEISVAPIVVMDFSYAIVNAVLNSINKCSLTKYVDNCFNVLTEIHQGEIMRTHVYLCSTDFLKSMIKKSKQFSNSASKLTITTFNFR